MSIFQGQTYNIPISLTLLDTHPYHAPMAFVKPTADMQIKVSKHVDASGKIYLPYLHEWAHPNYDLLGLVQMCVIIFSEQPPVFARPKPPPQLRASVQKVHLPYPECPICLDNMTHETKIMQCGLGHLLCQKCCDRLDSRNCPTCKGAITGRCHGMESYLNTLFNNDK